MVSWRPGQITFLISTLASFRKFISFSNILTKLGFFKRPAGLFLYISSIGDMIRIVKFFLLTNGGAEMDGWSFERILVVLLFITAGAVVIWRMRHPRMCNIFVGLLPFDHGTAGHRADLSGCDHKARAL